MSVWTISAKFASKCATCHRLIHPGEDVTYDSVKKKTYCPAEKCRPVEQSARITIEPHHLADSRGYIANSAALVADWRSLCELSRTAGSAAGRDESSSQREQAGLWPMSETTE